MLNSEQIKTLMLTIDKGSVAADLLLSLYESLTSESSTIKSDAIRALDYYYRIPENCTTPPEDFIWRLLDFFKKTTDSIDQQRAVNVLIHLNTIGHLIALYTFASPDDKRKILRNLRKLAEHHHTRDAFVQQGGLLFLSTIFDETDLELSENIAIAFDCIASDKDDKYVLSISKEILEKFAQFLLLITPTKLSISDKTTCRALRKSINSFHVLFKKDLLWKDKDLQLLIRQWFDEKLLALLDSEDPAISQWIAWVWTYIFFEIPEYQATLRKKIKFLELLKIIYSNKDTADEPKKILESVIDSLNNASIITAEEPEPSDKVELEEEALLPKSTELLATLKKPKTHQNIIPIGIQDKYIDCIVPGIRYCGRFLNPKKEEHNKKKLKKILPHVILFERLGTFVKHKKTNAAQLFKTEGERAYTLKWIESASKKNSDYIFIFAGRKENAYIPPKTADLNPVLVLTNEEYTEVANHIPKHCNVLVMHHLSVGHECYDLKTISARRLSAFIAAYHLKLKKTWIVDDNIESVHFRKKSSHPFKKLSKKMHGFVCVSIHTFSNYDKHQHREERRPGDKLFCLNFKKIRKKLPSSIDCFNLVYAVPLQKAWGVDYLKQIFLEELFPKKGYDIFPEKKVALCRSTTQQNTWVNQHPRPVMTTRDKIPEVVLDLRGYHEKYIPVLELIHAQLNLLIHNAEEKVHKKQTEDLIKEHARANQFALKTRVDLSALRPRIDEVKSREGFFSYLKMIMRDHAPLLRSETFLGLRDFQMSAINEFAKKSQEKSLIVLGTGCGKTRLELALIVLARIYYDKQEESILLVIPTIHLVEQAYRDFMELMPRLHSLEFNAENIIKVVSSSDAVSVTQLYLNQRIFSGTVILICVKSLNLYLDEAADTNSPIFKNPRLLHSPFAIFDEHHKISGSVVTKMTTLRFQPTCVHLTATPKKSEAPIFIYDRPMAMRDSYLPPAAVLKFKENFTEHNVSLCAQHMAFHLRTIYLPSGEHLREAKGMIYVQSIAKADELQERLRQEGFRAVALHSKRSAESARILQRFQEGKDEYDILIAVETCREGFNSHLIQFVFFMDDRDESNISQSFGRALRKGKHKVALFICFNDSKIEGLAITSSELYPGGCYDHEATAYLDERFKKQLETGLSIQPEIFKKKDTKKRPRDVSDTHKQVRAKTTAEPESVREDFFNLHTRSLFFSSTELRRDIPATETAPSKMTMSHY